MTKVKVCGLTSPEDVAIVNRVRPDYAGFVLAPGKHQLSVAQAHRLIDQLAPGIAPVIVLMAPDQATIATLHDVIAAVQLHLPAEDAAIRVLQAQGLKVFSRVTAEHPATVADLALLDAGAGSGITLDWQHLPRTNRPLMLAGGLAGDNVQEAISAVHPALVDASSRLEVAGHKDEAKVAAFVAAVKGQEHDR